VAIATLYLRKTGHVALIQAVRAGLVVSVAASVVLGVLMAKLGASSPMWEGILALAAAAAVFWCVFHMLKMGRHMSGEITAGMEQALIPKGLNAWWSVFGFTVFMVGREGVESAAMLSSLATSADGPQLFFGGLMGLAVASSVALLWTKYGRQINLSRFFNVTSVFMLAFAAMLVLKAVFEFTEVNLIPGIDNEYWHVLTEPAVEGGYAQIASVLLVLAPSLWLVAAHWLDRKRGRAVLGSTV
jgi:high-affinity iron transporter